MITREAHTEAVKQYKPWLHVPRPLTRPESRLFCFHYAGGRAEIFNAWPAGLPEGIEVCAVQLPGRSYRMNDTPVRSMRFLLAEIASAVRPLLDVPFAFFGHSLGALLAFELSRELAKETAAERPRVLFVSGRRAPQIPNYYPPISELPDRELLEVLRSLNGTPKEALQDASIMKLFIPAIRADFALEENWHYLPGSSLTMPIRAFCGIRDRGAGCGLMDGWREQTSAEFAQFSFDGEHFFIHQFQGRILELIADAMTLNF